jgi:hypothetical protein
MSLLSWLWNLFSRPAEPPPFTREIGRNEPCWCGSGRKYKTCHWKSDEEKRREAGLAERSARLNRSNAVTGRASMANRGLSKKT